MITISGDGYVDCYAMYTLSKYHSFTNMCNYCVSIKNLKNWKRQQCHKHCFLWVVESLKKVNWDYEKVLEITLGNFCIYFFNKSQYNTYTCKMSKSDF
jgi:hypothetical protein